MIYVLLFVTWVGTLFLAWVFGIREGYRYADKEIRLRNAIAQMVKFRPMSEDEKATLRKLDEGRERFLR